MMAGHLAQRVAFAAALAVLGLAVSAEAAAKVRCPVCGQIFEEDVDVCPNDGANLRVEGKPVEEAPAPEEGAGDVGDAEDEQATPGKYTRHDVGGDRQRADQDDLGYDDRRARLGDDRRGDEAAERRRRLRAERERELAAEDDRLRTEFEARRRRMWEGRQRQAEEDRRTAEGFEHLRRTSLWGRGAPLTSVGVRLSWMGEGDEPGVVSSAEIDVNLVKTKLRVGLSSSIGVRSLPHRDDLLFVESVSLGVQLPWRFSPYVLARAGVGALATNRFGEDITYVVRSLGAEVGLDCRVARWLVVTPSLGYVSYGIDNARWDGFTAKLSVGF
jgi:hypothetical protein